MRILLTRPEERSEPLAARLEAMGHEVLPLPLIAIETVDDGPVTVEGYDWVVVTSSAGAAELVRRMQGRSTSIAAIGPATAQTLRENGLEPDLVARRSTQEGLLDELPTPAGRVLFVGAEGARRLLVEELGADFRAVYRTRMLAPEAVPQADLAIVASPSAARALGALRSGMPVISIGPQTTQAAREGGVEVLAEAETHDLEGLVGAVERFARQSGAGCPGDSSPS
ncbi:MAG: uroporphyrinogen-III synthase [Gaiellaceae bacterium]